MIDCETTDLPDPDSPTSATVLPWGTRNDTPRTASIRPSGAMKSTFRLRTRRTFPIRYSTYRRFIPLLLYAHRTRKFSQRARAQVRIATPARGTTATCCAMSSNPAIEESTATVEPASAEFQAHPAAFVITTRRIVSKLYALQFLPIEPAGPIGRSFECLLRTVLTPACGGLPSLSQKPKTTPLVLKKHRARSAKDHPGIAVPHEIISPTTAFASSSMQGVRSGYRNRAHRAARHHVIHAEPSHRAVVARRAEECLQEGPGGRVVDRVVRQNAGRFTFSFPYPRASAAKRLRKERLRIGPSPPYPRVPRQSIMSIWTCRSQ